MSVWADGWRLSVGTLTALPVRPPAEVDRRRASIAIALAPLTSLLLAAPAAGLVWAGQQLGTPNLVIAVIVVGFLALGSRGLHLDGLADTADGLAAPKDREGRLAVMRRGDVGPVGAATLALVLGAQVAGLSYLVIVPGSFVVVLAAVCLSRCALALACVDGIPPARADGLGAAFVGAVPRATAVLSWALVGAALVAALWWQVHLVVDAYNTPDSGFRRLALPDPERAVPPTWWVQPVVAVVLAAGAVALLVRRAVRRLGGVTGDVCGAVVEIALAVLLVVLVV